MESFLIKVQVAKLSEIDSLLEYGAWGDNWGGRKYFNERSSFLRFYAYICHVIDDFNLFGFAALRQEKNLM